MARDHLGLPYGILKRFGYSDPYYRNNQIYRLKLCENKIETIDAFDDTFIKEDFFDNDLDKEIKEKIENNIGNLYKKISKNGKYNLNNKYDVMKGIWIIQYFRKIKYIEKCGKDNYNKMMKSICNRFLDTNFKVEDDNVIQFNYKQMEEIYNMYKPGYFKLMNINRTLILPHNQIAYILFPEEQYVFPIGKDVALVWKKVNSKSISNSCFIYNDCIVEKINLAITMSEMQNNESDVFYGEKEELIKIMNAYKQ